MSVTILNTDAGLAAKTLINGEDGQSVSGLKTFSRSPNPPFAVQAGSANVPNLDADKLDGLDSLAFVKADGTVAMTGALTATAATLSSAAGQLTLTGGQIVFPATQVPSAGVNTLDDYEEGTWTPVIGGSTGTSGQTYGTQFGIYVKVGQLVVASFNVVLSAKGTITGNAQLQGLPFAVNNTVNYVPTITMSGWGNLATNWFYVSGDGILNTTTCSLRGISSASGAAASTVAMVVADIGNTTQLFGTISYRASA